MRSSDLCKDGHLIRRAEEAQAELIGADLAERLERGLQAAEIDRPGLLVDLDGIAPAETDGRAALGIQVDEFARGASRTPRVGGRLLDLAEAAVPDVQSRDAQRKVDAANELHCVGYLQRRHRGGDDEIGRASCRERVYLCV